MHTKVRKTSAKAPGSAATYVEGTLKFELRKTSDGHASRVG